MQGPLILDTMLNRFLPFIFSPNIIASLMNDKRSFSEIRSRKWIDRCFQVALFGALLAGLVKLVAVVAKLVAAKLAGAA